MHEKIDEPVEVLVKFETNKIMPCYLKWRKKTYKLEKLNLVYEEKQGENKFYYFSVSDNVNCFNLVFSTKDLSWRIKELYYEG